MAAIFQTQMHIHNFFSFKSTFERVQEEKNSKIVIFVTLKEQEIGMVVTYDM